MWISSASYTQNQSLKPHQKSNAKNRFWESKRKSQCTDQEHQQSDATSILPATFSFARSLRSEGISFALYYIWSLLFTASLMFSQSYLQLPQLDKSSLISNGTSTRSNRRSKAVQKSTQWTYGTVGNEADHVILTLYSNLSLRSLFGFILTCHLFPTSQIEIAPFRDVG